MKTILVTGGAGYIGSAAVKALISKGHEVVVVDNLSKGDKKLVDSKADFYEVDLVDIDKLREVFQKHKFDSVMHFAAYKAVEESMTRVDKYSDNITGTINLLRCMVEFEVKQIIYSSTAAVYGIPTEVPVTEESPTVPINYYGYTKLASEQIIEWFGQAHNLQYAVLRYFNVAGDGGLGYIDPNANNILPIIMEVLSGKRAKLTIFGKDYDTPDGTCVRDYFDVNDLIDAHVLALDLKTSEIINLGTAKGSSVTELVTATEKVTGKKLPHEYGDRRPGDPAVTVSSNDKAKKVLDWEPKRSIEDMIKSMWEVYQKQ
ncbi:UDP-glucose 4-epimerase GalE [Patescibacteria group bacterium]|nr:UDP-glucose 4-epimerase GalE [Patescibacteria group bacterium]MBU1890207.1 UDP-glucose 4-epimerase GalE [Patescibacteria group bacterium]